MERCHWPGNVRQLENAVERAVYLAASSTIVPSDLPLEVREMGSVRPAEAARARSSQEDRDLSIRKGERDRIEQAADSPLSQERAGNVCKTVSSPLLICFGALSLC